MHTKCCLQDHCSLFQVPRPWCTIGEARSSISFAHCSSHWGVIKACCPEHPITVSGCTTCSGCKDCRQPLPLVIPEGEGGSGCSAEVAAVAEALHAAVVSKATSTQFEGGAGGSSTPRDGTGTPDTSPPPSNPSLVECAVCHRRPGDPGVPATLKLCGGCRVTRYCSTECQRKDWKLGHKGVCQGYWAMKKS
jgi:hypothetical protein